MIPKPDPIVDGAYLVPEKGFCSNVYVLEDKDRILLIDAGSGTTLPIIDSWIGKKKIHAVILTHGHVDHLNGMNYISADGFLHPKDLAALESINEFFPGFISPNNLDPLGPKPYKFGKFELQIIETPGHTPGSIALFEKKTGLLFSGDTKFAGGGRGRTDLPGGDETAFQSSLARLQALDYKILCPGHGPLEQKR